MRKSRDIFVTNSDSQVFFATFHWPELDTRYPFYSSQRGRPFDLWGGWGRRVWVISGKKYPADWFRGEKKSCKEMPGQKEFLHWRKKKNFMASAGKNLTPMYVRKKVSPEVWENICPPPPLLPKANSRPLSIKLQLGRFIPGNAKCNSYRWTRWTKSDRDDRDEKGERGSRGDSRGVKPHHCFVTITNIERISSQNLSMYQ